MKKKPTCHCSPIHDKELGLIVGNLNTRPSMRIDSKNRKVSKEIVPKTIRSAYCLVKVFLSSSPVRDLGSDMTTTTSSATFFMEIRVCSVTKLHALEYVGFHFDAFHLGTLIL